ncbi:hypothetical protein HELRODRAFT_192903 [Helobdella robusta]|uniref:Glycosyl transferase 64 domain-containing protein n=1 Tax=Helobdella robusta TaxID=6412 RepID=T1FUE7_HELRO|nr:hypothetical protein HELRODRAFT_192903 [Helobdella robusta]ESN98398.1 hypothetical protein HELRODRAFT_192903 [Helobdella robusta]
MRTTAKTLFAFAVIFTLMVTFFSYNNNLKRYKDYLMENTILQCPTGEPCVYESVVDLRVIVITYDRTDSVMKLLNSLQSLELDGDEAILEIWIDRNAKTGINNKTYEAVSTFKWTKGPTRIHNQTSHAGIMGQWIDTWRPRVAPPFKPKNMSSTMYPYRPEYGKEIALILEDDLSVSPQAYRFVKAAHRKYGGRADYAGVSLQSDEAKAHNSGETLKAPANESAFMYVCIGTWGFAPSPQYWAEFQDWFHYARKIKDFQPYLDGTTPGSWFRSFVQRGTADSMWEMWFIYFANKKNAYTVFSNLKFVNGDKADSCVGINRREVGLHYPSKGAENLCKLLEVWDPKYESMLPDNPLKLDWTGNPVKNERNA